MGLREKVALLILLEFFVQVIHGQYVQHTNKWPPSFQIPYKKYKIRKHAKTMQKPITREGCVARIFNFPQVEYSSPLTTTSPLHSYQNVDLHSQRVPNPNSVPIKYSVPLTNEPESRKCIKNHKNSAITGSNSKKLSALLETASVPNTCLNNELFFPSVDYPLDVTDLWNTHHYWNRFPQSQPETKLDIVDLSINTKSKKGKAKIAKGSRKDVTKSKKDKIMNSPCTETNTLSKTEVLPIKYSKDTAKLNIKKITAKSKQNATNCENNSNNSLFIIENLPKKEIFILTSKQCTTDSNPIKNNSVNSQELMNTQNVYKELTPHKTPDESTSQTSTCTSRNKENKDINRMPVNLTPNDEKSSYCTESTSSNIITFLKAIAPILNDSNENIFENSVLLDSQTPLSSETNICDGTEVEVEYEDSQLPDDMGYTIMYPELFSSLSTSTMSPLDENKIDNSWMYPEFDNHTFNTYSDEVEQCYILVP